MAKLSANARMKAHPDLFFGGDIEDWRCHCSPRAWVLIQSAVRAGIYELPEGEPLGMSDAQKMVGARG
jgi:hypothetical protein